MHILVYEWVAGGGCAGQVIPKSLLAQGHAMLRAAVNDFARAGHRVTTTRDARVSAAGLESARVVPVVSGHQDAVLARLRGECDAVLLIAPETGGVLADLTRMAETVGVPLLGSSAAAVAAAGDKWDTHLRLRAAGVPVPRAACLRGPVRAGGSVRAEESAGAEESARETGYPLVFKPLDGAGSDGVYRVRAPAELHGALRRSEEDLSGPQGTLLMQEWVEGAHASVSLLVAAGRPVPLALNAQDIEPVRRDGAGESIRYGGGVAGWDHPLRVDAFAVAARACVAISGLAGWVGVDLVLAERGPVVIEVNPRLTTAYVGLRAATRTNLAASILAAWRGIAVDPPRIAAPARFRVTAGGVRVHRDRAASVPEPVPPRLEPIVPAESAPSTGEGAAWR